MVEKMLDMARVGPGDRVVDLGSGDGRNVIAAAKRGARAIGVEFNPDLVALSRRNAAAAGVSGSAQFVEGDMFAADISQATVLVLFLIPENLRRLEPKFRSLAPGTRIVSNYYEIPGWDPAETAAVHGGCEAWCRALLYIVPARAQGAWRLPAGELVLEQEFETLSGTLTTPAGAQLSIVNGSVRGDRIRFLVGLDDYTGRVRGERMEGSVSGSVSGAWSASRIR
jgi:SAM-dependent methyltransferase